LPNRTADVTFGEIDAVWSMRMPWGPLKTPSMLSVVTVWPLMSIRFGQMLSLSGYASTSVRGVSSLLVEQLLNRPDRDRVWTRISGRIYAL
jgi:hypothetical protein